MDTNGKSVDMQVESPAYSGHVDLAEPLEVFSGWLVGWLRE
jgi:hypothetical protein